MVRIFESDACLWMFLCFTSNENQALEDLKKPPEDPLKLWKFYKWIFWNFLENYICANPTLFARNLPILRRSLLVCSEPPCNHKLEIVLGGSVMFFKMCTIFAWVLRASLILFTCLLRQAPCQDQGSIQCCHPPSGCGTHPGSRRIPGETLSWWVFMSCWQDFNYEQVATALLVAGSTLTFWIRWQTWFASTSSYSSIVQSARLLV